MNRLLSVTVSLFAQACANPVEPRAMRVEVVDQGDKCVLRYQGTVINVAELVRLTKPGNRAIDVVAKDRTPYRCVGFAVYSMQIAGSTKVGFITEAPIKNRQ